MLYSNCYGSVVSELQTLSNLLVTVEQQGSATGTGHHWTSIGQSARDTRAAGPSPLPSPLATVSDPTTWNYADGFRGGHPGNGDTPAELRPWGRTDGKDDQNYKNGYGAETERGHRSAQRHAAIVNKPGQAPPLSPLL